MGGREDFSLGGGDCRPQGQNFYFLFPSHQNSTKLHNAHPSHAPNTHPQLALDLREGGKRPKVGGKRLDGWARRFQLGGVTADRKVRISVARSLAGVVARASLRFPNRHRVWAAYTL